MAKPAQFVREVKREGTKVTWPTRKETLATTGIIVLFTFIASIFFVLADFTISYLIRLILDL